MMTIGLVSIVENPYIAVLLISIGAFSHQCLSTVAATLGGDLFKKDEVATAVGMKRALSGQLILNLFIGGIRSDYRGFACCFFIALAFFDIIGAIALWMLIKVKDDRTTSTVSDKLIILHRNAMISFVAFLFFSMKCLFQNVQYLLALLRKFMI